MKAKTSPLASRVLIKEKPSKYEVRVFCLKTRYCWPAFAVPGESNELNLTPGLDRQVGGPQKRRVGNLNEAIGAIKTESLPNEAHSVGRCATLERPVVGANNRIGVAIARPPADQARRRRYAASLGLNCRRKTDYTQKGDDQSSYARVVPSVNTYSICSHRVFQTLHQGSDSNPTVSPVGSKVTTTGWPTVPRLGARFIADGL